MELGDFFVYYPPQDDPNIQRKIFSKKEFNELKLNPVDKLETLEGEIYYPHQKIIRRLLSPMTDIDKLLLIHEAGTGKTCAAIAVAENVREYAEKERKVLILVKNYTLKKNFEREIAQKCTGGYYKALAKKRKVKVNTVIHDAYKIMTFTDFLKSFGQTSDEWWESEDSNKAISEYDNTVIIVDESHELRDKQRKKTRSKEEIEEELSKVRKKRKETQDASVRSSLLEKIDALKKEIKRSEKQEEPLRYYKFSKFFERVRGTKLLLLTATPILDRTEEIASQLNLVLDKKLPIKEGFTKRYFEKGILKNKEELALKINGRVSYLRSMTTSAKIIYRGASKPYFSNFVIFYDIVSKFQQKAIQEAKKLDGGEGEDSLKKGFLLNSRQSSNFVFPDGSWGQQGFSEYTEGDKRDKVIKQRYVKEIKENLAKYSQKFYFVIQQILDNPDKLFYVYSGLVSGSGLILFSALLRMFGYSRATGNEGDNPRKAKRFILASSDIMLNTEFSRAKELFNSPNNATGDYAQVFLGSAKTAVGISLMRGQEVHILTPYWNISTIYQALSRVLRVDAHPDPVTVSIYLHVSVFGQNGSSKPDPDDIAPDAYIYKIAEDKDKKDQQIYRVLKEASIDCPLTYKRNVLSKDVDGSRECNYQRCSYECTNVKPRNIRIKGTKKELNIYEPRAQDYSTYNLLYSSGEQQEIARKIGVLFSQAFILTLGNLNVALYGHNEFLIVKTLNEVISMRQEILNRYGTPSYLNEENNIYFLTTDVTYGVPLSSVYYCIYPYRALYSTIRDYLNRQGGEVEEMKKAKTVEQLLENVSFNTSIFLIERAYILTKTVEPENEKKKSLLRNARYIIKKYKYYFYNTKYGLVHRLSADIAVGVKSNVSRRKTVEDSVRLYVPGTKRSNPEWVSVNKTQEQEISNYIDDVKQEVRVGLLNNKFQLFGFVSEEDNNFKIMKKDEKRQGLGRNCSTIKLPDFIDFFIKIGYDFESPDRKELEKRSEKELRLLVNSKRKKSVTVSLANKNKKQLINLYILLSKKTNDICDDFKKFLSKNNAYYSKDDMYKLYTARFKKDSKDTQ